MKKISKLLIAGFLLILLSGCGEKSGVELTDVEQNNVSNSSEKEDYISEESNKAETPISNENNQLDISGDIPTEDVNEEEQYLSEMPDTEEKILELIDIKSEKTENGDIVLFITNNNDFSIPDIEVQILFYKNEEIVDIDEDGHDVLIPKNTVVSKLEAPNSYDDYEVISKINWDNDYKNWTDYLQVESSKGNNENIIVQITNNSEVKIDELEYIIVYYKENYIVDTSFAKDVRDIESGDKVIEEESCYGLEFDDFSVYINQAHTFGL